MQKPSFILGAALLLLAASPALASGEWEELQGCRLIEHEASDGDSFHVDVDGEERIFRLYFVDSPESEAGGRVASRISDQAETFGITKEESIEIGKKAAAFTSAVLSRPFTVLTRGQNATGASKLKREYAFVKTADGEDLGEMLVSRGLARSHGEDAATPDSKAGDLRDRYDALEAKARSEKVGAWGNGASVPTMALPESKDGGDVEVRSLVGIGAILGSGDGYAKVEELIPGGPADLAGELKTNDRIVGVAQGDGAFEDTFEMSLDQIVERIRGEKDSTVRLRVIAAGLPTTSTPKVISIVRDEVDLKAQQAAKKDDHVNSLLRLPERVETLASSEPDKVATHDVGRPVSFGRKSEALYQRDKSASERLRLDAPEDTVVKVIDYRTGRVMVIAWIAKNGFESRLWVGVPDGLYKIVYAQQVHEAADGEFHAGYYGKLRDPVEVRYDPPTSVNISMHDTEYPNVASSAKEFGSFRPPR
jgi:endonuclease YncB( thermonuclease family)